MLNPTILYRNLIQLYPRGIVVLRSLCSNAPGYLADTCQLVADARVRQLHSANTRTLVVSRTCSSFGDRTFAATGPQVWNSLPLNLRLCGLSYGQSRRLHFYSDSEATAQCELFLTALNTNVLTYLLTYCFL